ncbi:hypothetical protein K470DRAFT_281904 [Piedraia hortae CBS 480.64]|uniref:Orc1-like AAA ATPase domain-containing protein n=1 Tax=Piedraia hortae CBS 480.64 TaxID=1314780 RepID=A0A6A7C096_9PEZI|nr:hypothetical protein K470DRAFT_281904 [Piedraia hortae CBS 480.64]
MPTPPDEPEGPSSSSPKPSNINWRETAFKMSEAALTTLASVLVLGLFGYSYNLYYKAQVLSKIENAFAPGDPLLDLAGSSPPDDPKEGWVPRAEQTLIDNIIGGKLTGQYHLLVGEKGTGKSSMLIDAMGKIDGEGCSVLECHSDPEIFRIRLGKALDFEFHEDNIGALFSIRGPREGNALLDVERAFNKLEKIALRRRKKLGRPLILIINSIHLLRDDDNGRDLLELLQQRAEAWAAGGLATIVFNSDDYWVYERLKRHATRMNVIPIFDLEKDKAIAALRDYRLRYKSEEPDGKLLEEVYNLVGGRLTFLNRVARSDDMVATCEAIYEAEKTWFLNNCWILGSEMDDDVMDQQKYASAAMVLAKALVDCEKENMGGKCYDEEKGWILPEIPLHKAREIMTRADFIQSYDSINLFAIDSHAMVRADSVPMMRAFREICGQEGFEEYLNATLQRIGDIESLGRTRELTIKDLWDNGRYNVRFDEEGKRVTFEVGEKKEEEEGDVH